ncbi:MAG: type II toxin-antitoxin system PemK/MazF family toxin [bacterium]|nr:type II toxin-antitoxin system PemK/MazF family toxin [bacterium]
MKAGRGEIWWADLNPVRGSEQAGLRPVLVLQNDAIQRFTTTALTIPFTSNLRRASLPTCVKIRKGNGRLPRDSVALCHQLRVLDKSRLRRKMGSIDPAALAEVEACVLFTLGVVTPR